MPTRQKTRQPRVDRAKPPGRPPTRRPVAEVRERAPFRELLVAMWQTARDVWARRPRIPAGGPVDGFHCASCGETSGREMFAEPVPRAEGHTPVRCESCALVSIHPMPTAKDVRRFYADAYYGKDNAKFGPITELFVYLFRWARLRAVHRTGYRTGHALDIGCARGLFLEQMRRSGFEVFGTELSDEAATGARRRLGPSAVRVGTLAECGFDAGMFDVITAWQVFEHMDSPHQVLDECHRLLRQNGVLILAVPNIDSWQARFSGAGWFHLDVPRHLFHYSPATLTALLSQHDFRVERVMHGNLEQNPFGLLQSALHRLGAPFCGLYDLIRGRRNDLPPARRLLYGALYLAAFPVAVVVSCFWSCCRSGATITVQARRG